MEVIQHVYSMFAHNFIVHKANRWFNYMGMYLNIIINNCREGTSNNRMRLDMINTYIML